MIDEVEGAAIGFEAQDHLVNNAAQHQIEIDVAVEPQTADGVEIGQIILLGPGAGCTGRGRVPA